MQINIVTHPYNVKRLSRPEAFKVTFHNGVGNPVYSNPAEFICHPKHNGEAAVLRLEGIDEGDIILAQQKPLNPDHTDRPSYYQVRNGQLCSLVDDQRGYYDVWLVTEAKRAEAAGKFIPEMQEDRTYWLHLNGDWEVVYIGSDKVERAGDSYYWLDMGDVIGLPFVEIPKPKALTWEQKDA